VTKAEVIQKYSKPSGDWYRLITAYPPHLPALVLSPIKCVRRAAAAKSRPASRKIAEQKDKKTKVLESYSALQIKALTN
jgi:hypothetical protein